MSFRGEPDVFNGFWLSTGNEKKEEITVKRCALVAVLLLFVSSFAIPAHAINYECTGTVTYLGLNTGGDVVVTLTGGVNAVVPCNLNNNTSNGFTPQACKAAYSTLLAAKLSGQSVNIYFSDSLTCTTQPAWTPYNAVYFVATQ
jgi:hypothetical protein